MSKRLLCVTVFLFLMMAGCTRGPSSGKQTISVHPTSGVVTMTPTDKPTPLPAPSRTITPTTASTPIPTAASTPTPTRTPTPGSGSTRISPADGMKQIYIPEGEFLMGSSRFGSRNNELPHSVHLDGYWIDETEITNAMYARFLNARSYSAAGKEECCAAARWIDPRRIEIEMKAGTWLPVEGLEDHPVKGVSWYGAQEYCEWAGRRLPTEAEWEKAGRGGEEGYSFPWGNQFDCAKGNFGDYIDPWGDVILGGPDCDGYEETAPVGSFEEDISPYGVKDMAGNIMEWVFDWYDERYYFYSPEENPQGPSRGDGDPWEDKVVRGGGFTDTDWIGVRLPSRGGWSAYDTLGGFRCAQGGVP